MSLNTLSSHRWVLISPRRCPANTVLLHLVIYTDMAVIWLYVSHLYRVQHSENYNTTCTLFSSRDNNHIQSHPKTRSVAWFIVTPSLSPSPLHSPQVLESEWSIFHIPKEQHSLGTFSHSTNGCCLLTTTTSLIPTRMQHLCDTGTANWC